MGHLLYALPQDTLDAILSYDHLSLGALRLWMCGNSHLQYKLATGVTKIKLEDLREISGMRYPKVIENLRALRELTIDRDNNPMPLYRQLAAHVRRLPPTLKKLNLAVFDSIRVISSDLPSDALIDANEVKSGEPSDSGWTFATAFPHLEMLRLTSTETWTPKQFALLPSSLTELEIEELPSYADGNYCSSIPRQLLSLKVNSRVSVLESFWDHLPPQLTRLDFRTSESLEKDVALKYRILAGTPRTLTAWPLSFMPACTASLADLPPSISVLYSPWAQGESHLLTEEQVARLSLNFANLERIHFDSLPTHHLRLLPSTLRHLYVSKLEFEKHQKIEASHWPSSLTTLSWQQASGLQTDEVSSMFPIESLTLLKFLTDLSIGDSHVFDMDALIHLPPSLLSLSLPDCILRETVTFPPQLTYLSVTHHMQDANEPEAELGRWIELAPLNTDGSPENTNYNNSKARSTLHGRKVLRCFPFYALPASLLELRILGMVPASQLKHLPQRLKTLNVDEVFQDEDFKPEGNDELETMRSIFETGEKEGIREAFDWRLSKRASVLSMLPRTLIDISIYGDAIASIGQWEALPQTLETVWLRPSEGVPGSAIPCFPRCLKSLHLKVISATDAELLTLPRSMEDLYISFGDDTSLTRQSLLNFPYCFASGYSVPSRLRGSLDKLVELRKTHIKDDDPSFFLKLLTSDPDLVELIKDDGIET